MKFNELGLIDPLLKALQEIGYTQPTEIQEQTIPLILNGKDILGCAQTGTGKTAAFALPIIQGISKSPEKRSTPKALIIAPTRELAVQIGQNIDQYTKYLQIKTLVIFGGVSQVNQVSQLRQGIDILVATPGRLLDLMQQGYVQLGKVQTLVLDEADNMLDMGFINDIKKVLKNLPSKKQTLFFSATMPKEIRTFANTILYKPAEISVTPASTTAEKIDQSVYFVEKKEKTQFLIKLLKEKDLIQTLVFTRTKHGADRLVRLLSKGGISSVCIHGNKSQNARQNALNSFKKGQVKIMIATDIAARGIDIQELPQVINYDLPADSETYVHRIGRTGRAGKGGVALSFCSEDEKSTLQSIQKLIGFQLKRA